MPRFVTILDRPLPDKTIIEVNRALFENVRELPRSAIIVALKAFGNLKHRTRLHYKYLMSETGYSKPQVMTILRTLTNKGILKKIGNGTYIPNMRGDKVPVYRLEINLLAGCGKEQLRVWSFIKLNEGFEANTTRISKETHMFRTAVLRAVNDRPSGSGLYSHGLLLKYEGKLYTPTGFPDGVTPNTPPCQPSTHLKSSPIEEPRAHTLEDSSKSSTSYPLFRIRRTVIRIKNSITDLLTGVRQGSRKQSELPHETSQSFPWSGKVGTATLQNARTARTLEEFIRRIPELNQYTESIQNLFTVHSSLGRLTLLTAIRNALNWITRRKAKVHNFIGFLERWIKNERNVKAARKYVEISFGKQYLNPNQPVTVQEQLDRYEVCTAQTTEDSESWNALVWEQKRYPWRYHIAGEPI